MEICADELRNVLNTVVNKRELVGRREQEGRELAQHPSPFSTLQIKT